MQIYRVEDTELYDDLNFQPVASYRDEEAGEKASERLRISNIHHFLEDGDIWTHPGQVIQARNALEEIITERPGYIASD